MPDDWKAALVNPGQPGISGPLQPPGTLILRITCMEGAAECVGGQEHLRAPTSLSIDLSQYAMALPRVRPTLYWNDQRDCHSIRGRRLPVTFTPKLNTSGLGGQLDVNNGITTMSSTFGVLISQSGPSQSVVWRGMGLTILGHQQHNGLSRLPEARRPLPPTTRSLQRRGLRLPRWLSTARHAGNDHFRQ